MSRRPVHRGINAPAAALSGSPPAYKLITARHIAASWGFDVIGTACLLRISERTSFRAPLSPAQHARIGLVIQIAHRIEQLCSDWEAADAWVHAPRAELAGRAACDVMLSDIDGLQQVHRLLGELADGPSDGTADDRPEVVRG